MLNVEALVELQQRFPGLIDAPVAPFVIGGKAYDTDATPVVMGVVNLSRDSTYRESIALTFEAAVRKARVQSAEGAHVIDIGAESSLGDAKRVDSQTQLKQLVPVIEALTAEGIATSVESYDVEVVRACLAAGAGTVNMTSRDPGDEILAQVAEAGASVVMCFLPGEHARDGAAYDLQDDPIPQLHDYFAERVESARTWRDVDGDRSRLGLLLRPARAAAGQAAPPGPGAPAFLPAARPRRADLPAHAARL